MKNTLLLALLAINSTTLAESLLTITNASSKQIHVEVTTDKGFTVCGFQALGELILKPQTSQVVDLAKSNFPQHCVKQFDNTKLSVYVKDNQSHYYGGKVVVCGYLGKNSPAITIYDSKDAFPGACVVRE